MSQLGALFKQAVSTLSLPQQSLLNIGARLGKKRGGCRVIAIMCSFYRELMKCLSPKLRDWDLAEGHRYDSALAGNSSLRAAVLRALKVENATAMGMHVGHLLWDMEKFYDSIDLLVLAGELIKRNYPSEMLILGVLAHAAPRVLKVGQCLSEVIVNTGYSMVAGCQQAVSFAHGLIWELVHTLTHRIERCPVHQHVDDLSQPIVASTGRCYGRERGQKA